MVGKLITTQELLANLRLRVRFMAYMSLEASDHLAIHRAEQPQLAAVMSQMSSRLYEIANIIEQVREACEPS